MTFSDMTTLPLAWTPCTLTSQYSWWCFWPAEQSTLYGTWVDGGGNAVGGSSEVGRRPSGASRFVGADMPYWMRINGGIGLHVGIVPDQPASHGCIRVPASVQPLIYSKVDVGTPVTVTH